MTSLVDVIAALKTLDKTITSVTIATDGIHLGTQSAHGTISGYIYRMSSADMKDLFDQNLDLTDDAREFYTLLGDIASQDI
jgi:hypothetical protein